MYVLLNTYTWITVLKIAYLYYYHICVDSSDDISMSHM